MRFSFLFSFKYFLLLVFKLVSFSFIYYSQYILLPLLSQINSILYGKIPSKSLSLGGSHPNLSHLMQTPYPLSPLLLPLLSQMKQRRSIYDSKQPPFSQVLCLHFIFLSNERVLICSFGCLHFNQLLANSLAFPLMI